MATEQRDIKGEQTPPLWVRPFALHGFHLEAVRAGQALGVCPFCSRRGHFYIAEETQLWDCKVCGKQGNLFKFFSDISERNRQRITPKQLSGLAEERGISAATLRRWGVGHDGDKFTLPVIDETGKATDLRYYRPGGKIQNSPGTRHGLYGAHWLPRTGPIWWCEGEWDTMAMDEILRRSLDRGGVLTSTGGAGLFRREWLAVFQMRDVILVYDHDKAGQEGEAKAWELLFPIVRSLRAVRWPEDRPEGYDLRDSYMENRSNAPATLAYVRGCISDRPPNSLKEAETGDKAKTKKAVGGVIEVPPLPEPTIEGEGMGWHELETHFRRWLYMNDSEPLRVLLASCLANRLAGDPLWLFFVAPPGGSKSELIMSLDGPQIYSLTSMTTKTLVSGMPQRKGELDPSLMPRLNGRVLTIKDLTSILTMHEADRDEILGQLRDAYDGRHEKEFGTGIRKAYRSRFGIIAGVTPVVDKYIATTAGLGERFLKYRIRSAGFLDIGTHQIMKAIENVGRETKMREQLRKAARQALQRTIAPDVPPKVPRRLKVSIHSLAKMVAALRGMVSHDRYTGDVEYMPSPEIGTRLAKQLTKLAMGFALVDFRQEVNDHDYLRIARVARDTLPDRVERVVRSFYVQDGPTSRDGKTRKGKRQGEEWISMVQLIEWTTLPSQTLAKIIQDLIMLRVVQKQTGRGEKGRLVQEFRLSSVVRRWIEELKIFHHDLEWIRKSKKEGEDDGRELGDW